MSHRYLAWLVGWCVLQAAGASAQVSSNQFARGTELAIFVGGATADPASGAMFGGSFGWEMTRWTTIEGRGAWLDRGPDASAFTADLSARVNLIARRAVTPYVAAGFGLYRASFDTPTASMSTFYQHKMMMAEGPTNAMAFTDPVLRLTGGVDAIVWRSWTLRPELSALIVRSGGNGETLLSGAVSVGYRFESRPITPAR